ncbi:hypothetical protein SUDANB121_00473 [Nocardiopsis dassonvillei]|uniref:hypothetical protein n=1 Tax=Nocardiopsis dassonvillei TaxID=2014 RepID=UPI003F558A07
MQRSPRRITPSVLRLGRRGLWAARTAAAHGLGVWAALALVPALRLPGPVSQQALVVLVAVGVFIPASLLLTRVSRRPLVGLAQRNDQSFFDDADAWSSQSAWEFFAPIRRRFYIGLALVAVKALAVLATVAAVATLVWGWYAVTGSPIRPPGAGPALAATALAAAVSTTTTTALAVFTKRGRARGAVRATAQYVLCAGAVPLVTLLDGVRLGEGPLWQQGLLVLALAALFNLTVGSLRLSLPVPGAVSAILVASNALRLWLVAWLSTWMVLTLEIGGTGTFLLALAIITAVMAPARIAARIADARREARHGTPRHHMPHDPFWEHHQHHQHPMGGF